MYDSFDKSAACPKFISSKSSKLLVSPVTPATAPPGALSLAFFTMYFPFTQRKSFPASNSQGLFCHTVPSAELYTFPPEMNTKLLPSQITFSISV